MSKYTLDIYSKFVIWMHVFTYVFIYLCIHLCMYAIF